MVTYKTPSLTVPVTGCFANIGILGSFSVVILSDDDAPPPDDPPPPPKPAAPPKPEPPPKVDPGNVLESPRNLFEACKEIPLDPRQKTNWSDLDEEHRTLAMKDYQDKTKQWHAKYAVQGKTVQWTITVKSIRPRNKYVVIGFHDGDQIVGEATFSESASQALPKLTPGDKIRISGKLKSFVYKPGERSIFLDAASHLSITLDDARSLEAPPDAKK